MSKSYVPKNKIMTILRKASFAHKPRNEVKEKCKIDAALYECQHCKTYVYEGESQKNYVKYLEKYPNNTVIMQVFHMDHVNPVIDPNSGWVSWDSVINRMFCGHDGWQGLCPSCHKIKTDDENKLRKK